MTIKFAFFSRVFLVIGCALSHIILLGQPVPKKQVQFGDNPTTGKYMTLNGVQLYYEEYGKGQPLLLLHGNGGNIAYMAPQIEYFARYYRVIVMDCRGRGKSELGKDTLTYDNMTKDAAALLDALQVDSAFVVGRSDGGIIALLMAMHYPAKTKKIVAFGANTTPDAAGLFEKGYADIVKKRKEADTKLAQHDKSQNWELVRQRNRMMEYQPHITRADLQLIQCPALIMSCDRDDIPEEHTLQIYKNIRKANLCILPDETHQITKENAAAFNATVHTYLQRPYRGQEARGF